MTIEEKIDSIYKVLMEEYDSNELPAVTRIAQTYQNDPFKVLISTVISLRTRDITTLRVSKQLFDIAENVYQMHDIPEHQLQNLIKSANYYKNKSRAIKAISKSLIEIYDSKVPDTIEELIKLPNVGRKTANLVLVEGFGIPAVCVDTNVHKVCNRLGVVQTSNANETEIELRKLLNANYMVKWNERLLVWGQKICKNKNPYCKVCKLKYFCVYFKKRKKYMEEV